MSGKWDRNLTVVRSVAGSVASDDGAGWTGWTVGTEIGLKWPGRPRPEQGGLTPALPRACGRQRKTVGVDAAFGGAIKPGSSWLTGIAARRAHAVQTFGETAFCFEAPGQSANLAVK